jgi:hypothetical protein
MQPASQPAPTTISYYGNGFPVDAVSPARTALAALENEDFVLAQGVISVLGGDEGAPFVGAGRAVGYWDGGIGVGGFVIRRLGPPVASAQRALKLRLSLLTARTL